MNDNSPDIIKYSNVKAKKVHICIECTYKIPVGEVYEYVTGLWNGTWGTYKTCLKCQKLRDEYIDSQDQYFGELWDSLQGQLMPLDYNKLVEQHRKEHGNA